MIKNCYVVNRSVCLYTLGEHFFYYLYTLCEHIFYYLYTLGEHFSIGYTH